MSNEGSQELQRLFEERRKAAEKIEEELSQKGVQIGDVLTVRYNNGVTETKTFNGWEDTESGARYIKLGTGVVPPVYIVDIQKEP